MLCLLLAGIPFYVALLSQYFLILQVVVSATHRQPGILTKIHIKKTVAIRYSI
jgi:hypothetical protein